MIKSSLKTLSRLTIFITVLILSANIKSSARAFFPKAAFQLEFSPDESKVLSKQVSNIYVWETATGKLLQIPKNSDENYWDFVTFTADGKSILMIDDKDNIFRQNIETGQITFLAQIESNGYYAVSTDRNLMAVTSKFHDYNETIDIYQIDGQKLSLKKQITILTSGITDLNFLKSNTNLLAVDTSPSVVSLETGKIKKEFPDPGDIHRYGLSPNRNSMLIVRRFNISSLKPYILDLDSGVKRPVSMEDRIKKLLGETNIVGFSPTDSERAFIGGKASDNYGTGALAIWNVKTGKAETIIRSGKEIVAAAFTADGKNILYQDLTGSTVLADVKTGVKIREYLMRIKL